MTDTRRRALICHDDPDMQRAVAVILDRTGHEVIGVCATAAEATTMAAARLDLEVVVLDLALCGAAGLRMVQRLRADSPRCDVVVLSPFVNLRQAALESGALGLVEPDDLRDLETCLHPFDASHTIGCPCCSRVRTRLPRLPRRFR